MKKLIIAAFFAVAALMLVVSPACALELFEGQLPGVTQGLAAGTLPPPGLYFIWDAYYAPNFKLHDQNGVANNNFKVYGPVENPALLWVPGWHLLGGTYGAVVVVPWAQNTVKINTGGASPFGGSTYASGTKWGMHNTIISPFMLSWHLPDNFFLRGAFFFDPPDATSTVADSVAALSKINQGPNRFISANDGNPYIWAGEDYWDFAPNLGLSWLYHGWNLSADLFYWVHTKDNSINYQSGQMFESDFTLTYTWGKWTFGAVATTQNQTTRDKFDAGDGLGYRSQPNTRENRYAVGPAIGYDFGPCSVFAFYDFNLETENSPGGDFFDVRLVVPLGNPCNWFN